MNSESQHNVQSYSYGNEKPIVASDTVVDSVLVVLGRSLVPCELESGPQLA
jgi:hypothetical protein